MGSKADRLTGKIEKIVKKSPCRMGVSVRVVGKGSILEIDSERKFPLASVYKVPIMATLFHRVERGELDLEERLMLRDEDKSLGSDLLYLRHGLKLTLHDLCYQMIVHSDNTATDMIHYRLGIDGPEEYMKELGLDSFEIYCPCREYYIMLMGWSKRFKGMSLRQIAKSWEGMSREDRVETFLQIRKQSRKRSPKEIRERAAKLWGYADEKETAEDRYSSAVIDNHGSPKDITRLLELIVTNKITSRRYTDQMLEFMLLCDSRDRLPAGIPPSVMVANKTGTVPGTVNDSAIIFASKGNVVSCACFADDVKYSDKPEVTKNMAEIGLLLYDAFKR